MPISPQLHQDNKDARKDAGSKPASGRGKLTVFLGATSGTGKTFAMLQAARRRQEAGTDVVVGAVNTHGRPEMDLLLEGLDCLFRRSTQHSVDGTSAPLDLDAIVARRPSLLVADELARANPPASRHPKRWQDVEELLGAGVSVFATLNIYELESLKDVAYRLTDVVVEETVPDRMTEQAD